MAEWTPSGSHCSDDDTRRDLGRSERSAAVVDDVLACPRYEAGGVDERTLPLQQQE